MDKLDLSALLNTSYEICDALMKADVGSVRSEGRDLRAQFRSDLAMFGAYLAEADGTVAKVLVSVGQSVQSGDALLEIA